MPSGMLNANVHTNVHNDAVKWNVQFLFSDYLEQGPSRTSFFL